MPHKNDQDTPTYLRTANPPIVSIALHSTVTLDDPVRQP